MSQVDNKQNTNNDKDIHNESLINLYKNIGKKELKEENFNNIIKFITEMEQKEIIANKEKYQEMTIVDLENKLNSFVKEDFYKSCLYFKTIQYEKMKKEFNLLKQSNKDLDEMIDNNNQQLDELEDKQKISSKRINRLRSKLVEKNRYILMIEKILLVLIFTIIVLDIYAKGNIGSAYMYVLTRFDRWGIFNIFVICGLFVKIFYSRPKVKVIKIN